MSNVTSEEPDNENRLFRIEEKAKQSVSRIMSAAEITELFARACKNKKVEVLNVVRRTINLDFYGKATEYLALSEFKGERTVKPRHVRKMAKDYVEQTFREEDVTIRTICCQETGQIYRGNGRHTCAMVLVLAQKKPDVSLKVKSETYTVQTTDDVRKLHAEFDAGLGRTRRDNIHAHLLGSEYFPNTTAGILDVMAQGLTECLSKSFTWSGALISPNQVAEALISPEWHPTAQRVEEVLSLPMTLGSASKDPLKRAPVVHFMFELIKQNGQTGVDFLRSVKTGVGFMSETDPRHILREFLQGHSISAGRTVSNHEQATTSAIEMYYYCRQAWHSYRNKVAWPSNRKIARELRSGNVQFPAF